MQRLHGSTAKLVNDLLEERRTEFWRDTKGREYFDGCIRDEIQCRRCYRYILTQPRRHGLTREYQSYPHTHVDLEVERGVKRAKEIGAFLSDVLYPRYSRGRPGR